MNITPEKTVCIYCKSDRYSPLYNTFDLSEKIYRLVQCHSCKVIYLDPQPTPEELHNAYDAEYYGTGEKKFNPLIEKFIDHYHSRRALKIKKYIGRQGKVLDIGCGSGRFLEILNRSGNYDINGLELPGKAVQRASEVKGIRLSVGKLSETTYENNFFDAVTLFHVFEHLDDPAGTLDIVSRILKPGGILMMAFPNIDSFQSQIFKGKWLHLDPPRHLFFFKPADFTRMMKDRGYIYLEENQMNISNGFAFQQSLLNCAMRKREVLYEYLKGNREYVKEFSPINLFLQSMLFKITFPVFFLVDVIESSFRMGSTVLFTMRKKT